MKKTAAPDVDSSMMLYEESVDGVASFGMMPVTPQCPYAKAIYDPTSGTLLVLTKDKSQKLHNITKPAASGRAGRTSTERIKIESFTEFYLTKPTDVEAFVTKFTANPEFDYKRFIVNSVV